MLIYGEFPSIRMKRSVEEFFGEQHSAKVKRVAGMTLVINWCMFEYIRLVEVVGII